VAKKPVRPIVIRIPEPEVAELIALNPDMTTSLGETQYGAWQRYFLSLMRQDLERRKALLRASVKIAEEENAP